MILSSALSNIVIQKYVSEDGEKLYALDYASGSDKYRCYIDVETASLDAAKNIVFFVSLNYFRNLLGNGANAQSPTKAVNNENLEQKYKINGIKLLEKLNQNEVIPQEYNECGRFQGVQRVVYAGDIVEKEKKSKYGKNSKIDDNIRI